MPYETRWVAPFGLTVPTLRDLNGAGVIDGQGLKKLPFFMHETCAANAGDSWANFSRESFDDIDFPEETWVQKVIAVGTLKGTSRIVHAQIGTSSDGASSLRLRATPFVDMREDMGAVYMIVPEAELTDQCGCKGFMAEGEVLDWRLVEFRKRYKKVLEGVDNHVEVWRRIVEDLDISYGSDVE